MKEKIGLFCNVEGDSVVQNMDAENLYEVPLLLHKEGLDSLVIKKLGLKCNDAELSEWTAIVNKIKNLKNKVTIALVGKYVELHDAYMSVAEALRHAGIANDSEIDIRWIHSEEVTEDNVKEFLEGVDGILVPGGFGNRGIDGKILVAGYARENKIPYFGICLGMQVAVIEYAINVLGLKAAHSTELDENTPYGVIHLMPEQEDIDEKGGTMRLGLYPCKVAENTKAFAAYNEDLVFERHRHRYEFNNQFRDQVLTHGMLLSGLSPDERLVEIVELKDHPWFLGCQFHPEFKSRPQRPQPLFREFIKAALEYNKKK
jgi:CTP synthase